MEPLVALMRRFVVDFFNRHDVTVCGDIMEPDYTLRVGGHVIAGRDEQYVPAVQRQLEQFPGLGMTVHRVLASGDRIALHFSEHGAKGGDGGRVAPWSGIALYRWNGKRLTASVAEEDYLARRRQLTTGLVDPIDPPAPAPWDTASRPPDPDAEEVARRWLEQAWPVVPDGVRFDDEHVDSGSPLVFDVAETEVTELFSAGSEVAFHVQQTGHYVSGLAATSPRPATLFAAGMLSVAGGAVRSGMIIRDRAGLRRTLGTS